MDNANFNDVKQILRMHARTSNPNINEKTRMSEDLQIFGDDARDLLLEIAEKYETSFRDFPFNDYFANECSADMNYMLLKVEARHSKLSKVLNQPLIFFWWLFSSGKQYKTLKVLDLIDAIQNKKWVCKH